MCLNEIQTSIWDTEVEPVQVVLGATVAWVVLISSVVIFRLWFHPLAAFPGPKIWAVSQLPWIRHILRGRMWSELELLHRRFGPVVRIAPGEISICSAGAWRDIYASRPLLPKEPSSQTPPLNGAHSLFTSVGDDHRRLRGILAAGFSDKALREQSPLIEHHVSELIARLRRELELGSVIDIQRILGYAALDTITDLGYGESLDGLTGRNKHGWIARFFMHGRFSTVRMCLCYFSPLDKILDFVFLRLTRRQRSKNWAIFSSKIERRLAKTNESCDRPDLITPVADKVIDDVEVRRAALNANVKAKGLTKQELLSHSLASVVANSQLTTVTLTTCLYLLLRQEQALHHLISEIHETFAKEEDINVQSTQPLRYLDAVIQETMRIRHPTPINLPRVVPPEGRNIDGIFIPGNTIIGINLHVIQTSQRHFLEPLVFHPERFLPASDARYDSRFDQDVKAAYMPFSTGPRDCIGGKLFLAEARVTIAKLFWNFDLKLLNKRTDWLKDQAAYIVYEPKPLLVELLDRQR